MADTVKVKIPKRYYTVEQLAYRWECDVDDIEHLIETRALATRERLAARNGKVYADLIPVNESHEIREYYERLTKMLSKDGTTLDDWLTTNHYEFYHPDLILENGLSELQQLATEGAFDRVIMADEVSRFEREHGESGIKPLGTSERRTLLVIIAALCNEVGLDWSRGKGAPANIVRMTEQLGTPISEDTIRKQLSMIDDAIEARQKT